MKRRRAALFENKPNQVINYKMLYYLGDECTNVTGGWVFFPSSSSGTSWDYRVSSNQTVTKTKNADNIYLSVVAPSAVSTGYDTSATVHTVNKIDLSEYTVAGYVGQARCTRGSTTSTDPNCGIRVGFTSTNSTSRGTAYWATTCIYAKSNNELPNLTSVAAVMTISASLKQSASYAIATMQEMRCVSTMVIRMNALYIAKADNISGLTAYGSTISAIIANASSLLADKKAVKYMIYNCTGDFMATAIGNSGFISALNASPNKNLVLGNEHWAKFLALV